jgi:hypothetical protein
VTWLRGRGRVLSQALGYLRDYKDTNPALANYARHAIGEVNARHWRGCVLLQFWNS